MVLVLSNSVTKYTVFPVSSNFCSTTIEVGNALFGRFSGGFSPAKNSRAFLLRARRLPVKDSFSAEEKKQFQKKGMTNKESSI